MKRLMLALLVLGYFASLASAYEMAQGKTCDQNEFYTRDCDYAFDSVNDSDWTVSSDSSYFSNTRNSPSATDTSNVTVDLNASYPITNVEAYGIGGTTPPIWQDLYLYYSNDNATWTFVQHLSSNTLKIRVFNVSITARYIKINLANNTVDANGMLTWLGVYGTPAAVSPTLNHSSPINGTTYNTTSVLQTFSPESTISTKLWCSQFRDNVKTVLGNVTNATTNTSTWIVLTAGYHNNTIICADEVGNENSSSKFFYTWFLNLSVFHGNDTTYATNWNVTFSNGTNNLVYYAQNSPAYYWNAANFPTGVVTATVNHSLYDMNYSNTFTLNASNQTLLNVSLWEGQKFWAHSNVTNTNLASFTAFFWQDGNTSNNYTGYTANSTLNVSLGEFYPFGTYYANVTLAGYGTSIHSFVSNASALINMSFALTSAVLNITAFDEKTLAQIYWNATFSNETNVSTFTNVWVLSQSYLNLSNGLVNLEASEAGNNSYYLRNYNLYITSTTQNALNVYLLPTTANVILVRFSVQNTIGQPVVNATVNIIRSLGGSYITVGSDYTDSSGTTAFYMEVGATYYISVSATGYDLFYQSIAPVASDYAIVLTIGGVTSGGYPLSVFEDVQWSLSPYSLLIENETANFTLICSSTNASLTWYSLNISYWNGTNIFFENVTTSPSGGMISYSFNATQFLANGITNVSVSVGFGRNPSDIQTFVFWLYDVIIGDYSLVSFDTALQGSGLSALGFIILSTLILILLAGWISRYSPLGGFLTAAIGLGFFNLQGWMGSSSIVMWVVVAFSISAGGAWLFLRNRV